MRPPEGSETGRGAGAPTDHSPTCGERWPKIYYRVERRPRIARPNGARPIVPLSRRKRSFSPMLSTVVRLIAMHCVNRRRPIRPLWRARKFPGQKDTGTP